MPEPTNPNIITYVPTAAELEAAAADKAAIQDSMLTDTFTREALESGEVGKAEDLNAKYPSNAETQPVILPPKETGPTAEPFIDDSSVRMDDIRKVIADLHDRGQAK